MNRSSKRAPSTLLAIAAALIGCAQLPSTDQATTDGSSAGKPLTAAKPKKPLRGVMPVHRGEAAKHTGPINKSAPSGAHLTYFGGRVVSNMQVVQVLYGTGSYLPEVQRTSSPSIATFYQGILNSPYIDMLAQYDTPSSGGSGQTIAYGSFLRQVTIAPSAANNGASIDDTNIQAELAAQISAGTLPPPTTDAAGNNNTYYAVFFPHGKVITQGGSGSCSAFCAYHGTISNAGGHEVYYGVHPDMQSGSGCESGCGGDPTPFNNYTSVASHEMVETITDAEVGIATSNAAPLAWYDNTNGEIGDICNAQQGPMTGGDGVTYVVQAEFSNADNDCVYTSGSVTPPPPAPDFSLAASPASQTIAAGDSASLAVTAAASGGFSGKIQLSVSGLPSGATSAVTGDPSASGGATVTISTDSTISAGTYPLTITGTSGTLSHTASADLTVGSSAPAGDFALNVSPSSLSVDPGSSASAAVTVSGANGFADDVSLTVSGAPAGVKVSFDTTTISGGSGNANLTVAAGASAAAGTYDLSVTGSTAAGLVHSGSVSLTVNGAAPPPPAPGTVFSDDVESGDIGWLAYADNPSHPIWQIEETQAAHSGTHRWRSNPGRNYANNTGSYLISPSFSLAGYASANLTFFYKFHTEDQFDYFLVWISADNGLSWTQIAQGTGASSGWNGWAPQASLDLSSYTGSDSVRLAFSIQSDGSVTSWGAAIDDVVVTAQ